MSARRDRQVKIRGCRVELGEIESVLMQHPAVGNAVVLLSGERLIAYVSPVVATDDVRRFMAERLPDWMLPATYVALAELPRTATGKIDRLELPPPSPPTSNVEGPRSDLERDISAIWTDVLGIERVGVTTTSSTSAAIR